MLGYVPRASPRCPKYSAVVRRSKMISSVRLVFTAASSCGRGAIIATTPLRAWNPATRKRASLTESGSLSRRCTRSIAQLSADSADTRAESSGARWHDWLACPASICQAFRRHTVQRGNNRLSCFLDDGVRLRYPRGLQEALIAISVQCTLTFTPIRARSWRHPLNKPVAEENLFAIRNHLREQRLGLRRLPRHARSQEQKLRWRPLAPHQPCKPDK